jgi:glutathione synthase/RimK-type ligase-like ATP-grasp enzyme
MTVLIVSMPNDYESASVQWALRKLGTECDILYTCDLAGGAEWSYRPDAPDSLDTEFRGARQHFDFQRYSTVWMRRPNILIPRPALADRFEQSAAERDCSQFMRSMIGRVERGKFVASRFDAMRTCNSKPFQFSVAREIGLPLPPTLISNSRERILRFFHEHGGRMVYKALTANAFMLADGNSTFAPTSLIQDEALLRENDLASTPGICQPVIDKTAEIRVTILGRSVFAVEKTFPRRSAALHVDWRGMNTGAVYREHTLPAPIVEQSIRLLRELGLVMGMFDFLLDREGNYHFLEVNPQGQFMWADQHAGVGLNHLEGMAQFLRSRDPDFQYVREDRVTCADFDSHGGHEALRARELAEHYGDVLTFHYGAVSFPVFEQVALSPQAIAAQVAAERARGGDSLRGGVASTTAGGNGCIAAS